MSFAATLPSRQPPPPRPHFGPSPSPAGLTLTPWPSRVRRTALLVVAATVTLNAAFTVLGSVLGYPDVLAEPAAARAGPRRRTPHARSSRGSRSSPPARSSSPRSPSAWRPRWTSGGARTSVVLGVAAALAQAIGLEPVGVAVPFLADHPTAGDKQTYRLAADRPRHRARRDHRLPPHAAWTVTLCLGARALLPAALRWTGWPARRHRAGALVPSTSPAPTPSTSSATSRGQSGCSPSPAASLAPSRPRLLTALPHLMPPARHGPPVRPVR